MFVHPILNKLGLRLVGWSARGYDGRENDVDRIVKRITKGLRPGAIVLLHETQRTPDGGSLLLETLPRVLDEIQRRNLQIADPAVV
jgi:peptidoglycan/xylan/chitin deacetylase (PgdA/CDA1 family)